MAQASPQLQQFLIRLWDALDPIIRSAPLKALNRWLHASKGWLAGLAVVLLLLMWNWQLVLSGGAGLVAMVLVYLFQQGQWQLPQVDWRQAWSRSNRPLTLALGTGLITSLSLYLSIAIAIESGGSWLAKGLILQGLGILLLLLLMIWQRLEALNPSPSSSWQRPFDQWLTDLSDSDPLKRLIAIRQITQAVITASRSDDSSAALAPSLSTAHITECFRLMLNRETEPVVCRALVDSLQALGSPRSLHAAKSSAFHPPMPSEPLAVKHTESENPITD